MKYLPIPTAVVNPSSMESRSIFTTRSPSKKVGRTSTAVSSYCICIVTVKSTQMASKPLYRHRHELL